MIDHQNRLLKTEQSKLDQDATKQYEWEKNYIFNNMSCDPYHSYIPAYKMEMINNYMKSEYMLELKDFLNCHTYNLIQYITEWQKLRYVNVFGQWRSYGSKSVYGTNFRTGAYPSGQENIIVKSANREDQNVDLIHEYVVGSVLNELRSQIPNFSMMLGVVSCGANYNNGNGIALQCLSQDQQFYSIVYEKSNGMTMSQWLNNDIHFDYILDVLVQLFLALQMAWQKCKFTHYDLHTENVLVEELNDYIVIKYVINGQDYYLKTKYIVHIIDYGLSRIEWQGHNLANYAFFNIFLGPYQDNPAADILHITSTVIYWIIVNRPSMTNIYQTMSKYKFFPILHSLVQTMIKVGNTDSDIRGWYEGKPRSNHESSFVYPFSNIKYTDAINAIAPYVKNLTTYNPPGVRMFKNYLLPNSVLNLLSSPIDRQQIKGNLVVIAELYLEGLTDCSIIEQNKNQIPIWWNKHVKPLMFRFDRISNTPANALSDSPKSVANYIDYLAGYFDLYTTLYCYSRIIYMLNSSCGNLLLNYYNQINQLLEGKLNKYAVMYKNVIKLESRIMSSEKYNQQQYQQFISACHPDRTYQI